MAVPKFFEFFVPTLRALDKRSPMKIKELCDFLVEDMLLSDQDMAELLPSGKQPTYKNRIHWSLQYLKNAGLVKNVERGTYAITDQGKVSLAHDADKIDLHYLEQFDSFVKFHGPKQGSSTQPDTASSTTPEVTPQEAMENADKSIREELAKSLLVAIMECSPDFFERLVVDLLLAMGYGYDANNSGMVVGKTGDGGIDGIINEDKLGFSQVYVQAKRWDSDQTIGSPAVQAFAGALLGKGATKGLYITTARFSKAARQFVQDQKAMRIVLIDGSELAKLMIDNGVGVSVQKIYSVMQLDSDYFEE